MSCATASCGEPSYDAVDFGEAHARRVGRPVIDERHVPAQIFGEPHHRHGVVARAEHDERRRGLDALYENECSALLVADASQRCVAIVVQRASYGVLQPFVFEVRLERARPRNHAASRHRLCFAFGANHGRGDARHPLLDARFGERHEIDPVARSPYRLDQ